MSNRNRVYTLSPFVVIAFAALTAYCFYLKADDTRQLLTYSFGTSDAFNNGLMIVSTAFILLALTARAEPGPPKGGSESDYRKYLNYTALTRIFMALAWTSFCSGFAFSTVLINHAPALGLVLVVLCLGSFIAMVVAMIAMESAKGRSGLPKRKALIDKL